MFKLSYIDEISIYRVLKSTFIIIYGSYGMVDLSLRPASVLHAYIDNRRDHPLVRLHTSRKPKIRIWMDARCPTLLARSPFLGGPLFLIFESLTYRR